SEQPRKSVASGHAVCYDRVSARVPADYIDWTMSSVRCPRREFTIPSDPSSPHHLGPIESPKDPGVTEVVINEPDDVFLEREGGSRGCTTVIRGGGAGRT